MTPSWYDVLDVADDASTEEIRAAWQASVAGLDPTDRRFKQRNRAAEVLLDPQRRAAHDRDLAAQDEEDDSGDEGGADQDVAVARAAVPDVALAKSTASTSTAATSRDRRPGPSDQSGESGGQTDQAGPAAGRGWLAATVGLGVLALVLLVVTIVSVVAGGDSAEPSTARTEGDLPSARDIDAARRAAELAVVPVLSYDYRDLDKSFAAARAFMTPRFAEIYAQTANAVVESNAPGTESIVTTEVVTLEPPGSGPASGIVRTGKDRVDVLVFVNRPTRNKAKDVVYRDQVTMRMIDVDGQWLVDCLATEPGAIC